MKAPPFHKLRKKTLGDCVKIPRHAADESRGYHHGKVITGNFNFEAGVFLPDDGNNLIVEWDNAVPFLGKYSSTIVAIKLNRKKT